MRCTVIIPTKDRPESLIDAVRSALNALPDEGEVIVVDDKSLTPATEILSELMDQRVRIIVNTGPNGPSQARNLGVRHAVGRIVFFLDDDDKLMPDYCTRVLSALDSLPSDCTYGHCAPFHMENDGPPTYHGRGQATGVYGKESGLDSRLGGLGMGFWIHRDCLNKAGGIDTNLRVNEDTELCIRLASLGYSSFYDSAPGIILRYDDTRNPGDAPSITKSSHALERARGFEYILSRHSEYLQNHHKFRRTFLSRVIKYRSRAQTTLGYVNFSKNIRPMRDSLLMLTIANMFLRVSIMRRKRK